MTATAASIEAPAGAEQRRFPPITALTVLSLTCVVIGGIIIASYAPRKPPLGVPIALLVASVVLYAAAIAMLVRIRDFAWATYFKVGKWALLAYVISAGMIEFAFVHNDTPSDVLTVLTMLLVVFVLDVSTTIAYTVARYASEPSRSGE
jgi:hypothetical protein